MGAVVVERFCIAGNLCRQIYREGNILKETRVVSSFICLNYAWQVETFSRDAVIFYTIEERN